MKERRLAREVAMQVLFQWEAQGVLVRHHEQALAIDPVDIDIFLGHFIASFYPRPEKVDQAFAKKLLKGILVSLVSIDALLDARSVKWKLVRMDAIDRAILRLACFELAYKKELAPKIIINEAIEIAKRYGSEQSAAFVNGILNSILEKDKI